MTGPSPAAKLRASSFYMGMRILPRAEREAIFAIYRFCRIVDDIADDTAAPRGQRAAALARWRAQVEGLYADQDPGTAAFLAPHIARFGLAREDFLGVIDGMAMDVAGGDDGDIRWPPQATLDLYVDRVASAVGRLSVRVFGMAPGPGGALAHHLGRALQLTNILRDLDEDAGLGRVYLPTEALASAGIAPTTPAALMVDPRLDGAARWLAAKAEAEFAAATAILRQRPAGRLLAPRLMAAAYAPVLARMQRQGWAAPRQRVRVNKRRLALLALRLWLLG